MGYQRKFESDRSTDPQPPCMHLRSKAIYVTGNPDPQSPGEEGSTRFNCWCNQSQHVVGPDQGLVDRDTCVSGRGCFFARG